MINIRGLIVGDINCGKSALMSRLCGRAFPLDSHTTIGVDVMGVRREPYRFTFQDTAGDVRFQQAITSYLHNIAFCLIVYDVGSTASLQSAINWLSQLHTVNLNEHLMTFLIANKQDLPLKFVDDSEGKLIADCWNATFIPTSAKTNQGVEQIFERLIERLPGIIEKIDMNERRYGIRKDQVEAKILCDCVVN